MPDVGLETGERIRRIEDGLLPPVVVKVDGQTIPKLNLAARMKSYKVTAVGIAVIANGKLEWARGYGVTAVEEGTPVTTDTLFQAASISKPIAAMVALRLVDEGKLALDD